MSPGDEHDAAHGCRSMAALGAFVGAHLLMDRAYGGGIPSACWPNRPA